MPTGYTSDIEKGITFKEYALKCARAFGACIEMRDDDLDVPIPEFKPSDYNLQSLKRSENQLILFMQKSKDNIYQEMISEWEKARKYATEQINKCLALRKKYENMLKEVEAYIPPSSEHIGFRGFMRDQIKESIEHDCSISYYSRTLNKKRPTRKDLPKYIKDRVKQLTDSIKYDKESHEKEVARVKGNNAWIKALKESLGIKTHDKIPA